MTMMRMEGCQRCGECGMSTDEMMMIWLRSISNSILLFGTVFLKDVIHLINSLVAETRKRFGIETIPDGSGHARKKHGVHGRSYKMWLTHYGECLAMAWI